MSHAEAVYLLQAERRLKAMVERKSLSKAARMELEEIKALVSLAIGYEDDEGVTGGTDE